VDNPVSLNHLLNSLLLDRARTAFPRGPFHSTLNGVLAICGRHGELILQDAAAFLVVSAAQASRYTLPWLDTARGCAVWLSALATHEDVVAEVWRTNRGAVLFGLVAAGIASDGWAIPRGEETVAALVNLLFAERRRAVPDRKGISFRVFERTMEGLGKELLAARGLEGRRREVMGSVPDHVHDLLRSDWDRVRTWATGLRGQPWHWPGESPAPGIPIRAREDAARLDISFVGLCPTSPHSLVIRLAGMYDSAAESDLRLYDSAPLAVAFTSLLLDQLTAIAGDVPAGVETALLALASRDWNALVDGAALSAFSAKGQAQGSQAADAAAGVAAWLSELAAHPALDNVVWPFAPGQVWSALAPLIPAASAWISPNAAMCRAELLDLLVRETVRVARPAVISRFATEVRQLTASLARTPAPGRDELLRTVAARLAVT